MGDKLNVGVIGLGFFGSMHAKVWATPLPNAKLAALSDIREGILREMGTHLGVKSCYTDYKEMLANSEIDAVDVVVDEDKHYEVVMEALSANKHVMVEKPIATELRHAEEMAKKASACKRIMMVGHILRFDLRHYFLKKQIQDGLLGDVVSIHARRNTARVSSGKDALGMAVRVHPILTTSIHDIDLMHWLTNDTVKKVCAEHRAVVDGKHHDSAWAMFTFSKGAVGIVETVLHLPGKSPGLLDYSITVIGTKGAAKLSSGRGFEIWGEEGVVYPDTDFVQPFVDGHIVGPLREELTYFADHAKAQREPSRITVRDAVNATRVCLAVVQSAKEGKLVELNY